MAKHAFTHKKTGAKKYVSKKKIYKKKAPKRNSSELVVMNGICPLPRRLLTKFRLYNEAYFSSGASSNWTFSFMLNNLLAPMNVNSVLGSGFTSLGTGGGLSFGQAITATPSGFLTLVGQGLYNRYVVNAVKVSVHNELGNQSDNGEIILVAQTPNYNETTFLSGAAGARDFNASTMQILQSSQFVKRKQVSTSNSEKENRVELFIPINKLYGLSKKEANICNILDGYYAGQSTQKGNVPCSFAYNEPAAVYNTSTVTATYRTSDNAATGAVQTVKVMIEYYVELYELNQNIA